MFDVSISDEKIPSVEPSRHPLDGAIKVRRDMYRVTISVITDGKEQITEMSEWQARRIFGALGQILFGITLPGIDFGGIELHVTK